jgi:mRNA-degrading endonuclease toxin of MazEF toxin-antitoxin module
MVDKVVSIPRTAIGRQIEACDPISVDAIDHALRVWLAL